MKNASKQERPTPPTIELHGLLQSAYDFFNVEFFNAKLPDCMITTQREKKVMGYFSPNRWVHSKGESVHEIAINPAYFANVELIQGLQTIGHEMCHLWRYEKRRIEGDSRNSAYHDKVWAQKMEEIGLTPSHNGLPGGRKTGQKMSDYVASGSRFETACTKLVSDGFRITWVDSRPALSNACHDRFYVAGDNDKKKASSTTEKPSPEALIILRSPVAEIASINAPVLSATAKEKIISKRKSAYQCPECKDKFWAKQGLDVTCNKCDAVFEEL